MDRNTVRVAVRLRDGTEIPVNALSHTRLLRSRPAFPPRMLGVTQRCGLPLPDQGRRSPEA